MADPRTGAAVRHATETVDTAIKGAQAYEREDLVDRLRGARRLLAESSTTVNVVGEFKQGKSSLVNALLTAPICPVDDDLATAVPTEVRYAKAVTASAEFEPASGAGGSGWTEPIAPSDLAGYVSEAGNPGNTRRLRRVSVGIDRPLLSNGLVLVDTPGAGGLGSVSNAVALSSLPRSHAVLFVSDCSQELTESEVGFLRTVQELCPTVVLVVTKTDLYPRSARMLERDRELLRKAGLELDAVAVSSELRRLAADAKDRDLNVESGFPTLVAALSDVVTRSEAIALEAAVAHVLSVVGQLEVVARARLDTLVHPEKAASLVEALTVAKGRADALRERTSKWQTVLADGFSDISSDIDFDLRSRTRTVLAEAESRIDDGDPAKDWAEFEEWLRRRLAAEALENYALFVRRSKEVATTVAEHVDAAEAQVVEAREVAAPVELVDSLKIDASFVEAKAKGTGMAVFQKSYGGFLMFTMFSTMAGLSLPLALGLVPGLLMGRSGFREERRRQLEKRRGDARAAVRRFVDDFTFHVAKDSRDAVRHVQRELRSAWSQRVAELQRSSAEALAAAQTAARAGESDVGARERAEADLATLGRVRDRVDDLAAHLERARTALPADVDPDTPAPGPVGARR